MTTEQQHASAAAYANEYLHKQYGIKDDILKPSTTVADPTRGKSVTGADIQPVDNQVPYSLANEQKNMNQNQNTARSNVQDHPAQTVKKQVDQVSQLPQDVAGTVMDAVTHPDRFFSNDSSTPKGQPADANKPQIPD